MTIGAMRHHSRVDHSGRAAVEANIVGGGSVEFRARHETELKGGRGLELYILLPAALTLAAASVDA